MYGGPDHFEYDDVTDPTPHVDVVSEIVGRLLLLWALHIQVSELLISHCHSWSSQCSLLLSTMFREVNLVINKEALLLKSGLLSLITRFLTELLSYCPVTLGSSTSTCKPLYIRHRTVTFRVVYSSSCSGTSNSGCYINTGVVFSLCLSLAVST